MVEIIQKIEEVDDYPGFLSYKTNGEGYKITTNKQEILILVSNESCCCESWGYFSSEDNLEDFIGSELRDIIVVDTELNVESVKKALPYGHDGGDTMFVNLETNRGTLQLAVYNDHNGYYGHSAILKSKQLTYETGL